jgi:hypothetical protein
MKNINIRILLISILAILLITAISLVAAGVVDEGTGGDRMAILMLSKLFYVFRFPMHILFWNMMDNSGWFVFLGLLVVNGILYGVLIERIVYWLRMKRDTSV